jgi:rfaE bifunctional protein nucleotidyltransferase chain/domain
MIKMNLLKLINSSELVDKIQKIKSNENKIVFTNGCFDLIHAGHVDYMTKAKALGDILIVGVNSDLSVKKIKDHGRPIVKEDYRLMVLDSISVIDYLVLFDDDTPLELIKTIEPNVLVKGADWKNKGVVGEDIVKSYGGRVELIDLLPEISTSIIIDKILKSYNK